VAERPEFPTNLCLEHVPEISIAIVKWLEDFNGRGYRGYRGYQVEVAGFPQPEVRLTMLRGHFDLTLAIPARLEHEDWQSVLDYIKSKWRECEVKSR
jgi:hypothetical protein